MRIKPCRGWVVCNLDPGPLAEPWMFQSTFAEGRVYSIAKCIPWWRDSDREGEDELNNADACIAYGGKYGGTVHLKPAAMRVWRRIKRKGIRCVKATITVAESAD